MRFEEEFGAEVPDKAAEKMETPTDVRDFLVAELSRRGRPADPVQILQRVRELTAEQSGLDLAKIGPNSRFVADLGMD